MKYNPQVHHRRSIRLKGYDYAQAGAYFITICCHDRLLRFGNIEEVNGEAQMMLNDLGRVAYEEWTKLPARFANVEPDVFQVMPNHMHGIIVLNLDITGVSPAAAIDNKGIDNGPADTGNSTDAIRKDASRAGASPAPTGNATIGSIVGAYKSLVANGCLKLFKSSIASVAANKYEMMGQLW